MLRKNAQYKEDLKSKIEEFNTFFKNSRTDIKAAIKDFVGACKNGTGFGTGEESSGKGTAKEVHWYKFDDKGNITRVNAQREINRLTARTDALNPREGYDPVSKFNPWSGAENYFEEHPLRTEKFLCEKCGQTKSTSYYDVPMCPDCRVMVKTRIDPDPIPSGTHGTSEKHVDKGCSITYRSRTYSCTFRDATRLRQAVVKNWDTGIIFSLKDGMICLNKGYEDYARALKESGASDTGYALTDDLKSIKDTDERFYRYIHKYGWDMGSDLVCRSGKNIYTFSDVKDYVSELLSSEGVIQSEICRLFNRSTCDYFFNIGRKEGEHLSPDHPEDLSFLIYETCGCFAFTEEVADGRYVLHNLGKDFITRMSAQDDLIEERSRMLSIILKSTGFADRLKMRSARRMEFKDEYSRLCYGQMLYNDSKSLSYGGIALKKTVDKDGALITVCRIVNDSYLGGTYAKKYPALVSLLNDKALWEDFENEFVYKVGKVEKTPFSDLSELVTGRAGETEAPLPAYLYARTVLVQQGFEKTFPVRYGGKIKTVNEFFDDLLKKKDDPELINSVHDLLSNSDVKKVLEAQLAVKNKDLREIDECTESLKTAFKNIDKKTKRKT